jgi:hypothetical protein
MSCERRSQLKVRSAILEWLIICVLAVASSAPAWAEFNAKDGQVLGRTLGYTGDGKTGVAVVGIVFAPANNGSEKEAQLVGGVIGDGLVAGRIRLQARLIPVEQLAGATGVNALYLTAGLSGSTEAIFAAAQRLQVPTIAANLTCVEAGYCVVGFTTEPTVQILLNQGAAERIGIHFLQAFRMLVREQ